jgi:hypothetical protein
VGGKQTWHGYTHKGGYTTNKHYETGLREGLAGFYRGIWIVNICAPSGSSDRQERENFYLFVTLTATNNGNGGDFNCVMTNVDCTGNIHYSKSLEKIIRLDKDYC